MMSPSFFGDADGFDNAPQLLFGCKINVYLPGFILDADRIFTATELPGQQSEVQRVRRFLQFHLLDAGNKPFLNELVRRRCDSRPGNKIGALEFAGIARTPPPPPRFLWRSSGL